MSNSRKSFSGWSGSGGYFRQLWSSGSQTVIQVGLKWCLMSWNCKIWSQQPVACSLINLMNKQTVVHNLNYRLTPNEKRAEGKGRIAPLPAPLDC
jgi:hypothetical protein